MEELTSRERVRLAANRQQPDRVPLDLVPMVETYRNLIKYLELDVPEDVRPGGWTTVSPHPRVMDALGMDIVRVESGRPEGARPAPGPDGSVADEWGVGRKQVWHGTSYYNEITYHPLAEATVEDLENYPWPDPDDPGRTRGLEEKARRLYEETEYGIMARFGDSVNDGCWYLRGQQQWMMDYILNPEFVETLLDKVLEITIRINENCMRAAGKYVDILRLGGEDMGTQQNLLWSPEHLRRFWFPRLTRLISRTREVFHEYNPNGKIMLHTDGAIRPIIPDLIECGVDMLDPIQPRPRGMDAASIKQEFGDRLAFHGGIDLQEVLPNYTPEQVQEEVRQKIRELGPGGGYIVCPAHSVPEDCPPENIVAMCQAVLRYGRYPLEI